MYKTVSYAVLFLVMVVLQLFLMDNLSISIYINPLVYIAFVVLLPLDTKPIVMLLSALALGVTVDALMGAAGLNTIATLFVAFFRGTLAGFILGRDDDRETGIPSPERMGMRKFLQFMVTIVVVHHAIFFLFESLSTAYLFHTLLRTVLSSALSVGAVWLIVRLFTAKIPVRI